MSQHIVTYIHIYIPHHHASGSEPLQGSGLGTLDAVGQVEIRYVRSPGDLTVGCFDVSLNGPVADGIDGKMLENEDKVDFVEMVLTYYCFLARGE